MNVIAALTSSLSQSQPDIRHSNLVAWMNVVGGPGRKAGEFFRRRVAAHLLRLLWQLVKTPILRLVFSIRPLDLKYASLARFRHKRD